MARLARDERFEEAADLRDRAASLAAALRRKRSFDAMRDAGRVVLEVDDGGAELLCGRLVRSWTADPGSSPCPSPLRRYPTRVRRRAARACDLVDELSCVASWLDEHAPNVRLVETEAPLAFPLPRLPTFTPSESRRRSRSRG